MAPALPCLEKEKDMICFHTRPPWPQLGPRYFWNDPNECTSLFCQLKKKKKEEKNFVLFYFLLSRMDNASRQRFHYATGERETTCLGALLQPCAAHESDSDVCVCVFPVETTVDDKPPTASQETEQPSVPVHTGKFCSITTFLLWYLVFSFHPLLPPPAAGHLHCVFYSFH